jgi:enhancing lycopene biosynthesis protein 2
MREKKSKKVAILLCGSGFKDGSEIHESVLTLLALAESGAESQCFALDEPQHDVVNCLTGEVSAETRIQRVEAARIARGDVRDLRELHAKDFDAFLMPGGFGAAKNLCDYARHGIQAKVHPEVARVLDEFWIAQKPIGAICIAPMILALHFQGKGLTLALGPSNPELESDLRELGHHPQPCAPGEICRDPVHPIVTTPAYMHDHPRLEEVAKGIRTLTESLLTTP